MDKNDVKSIDVSKDVTLMRLRQALSNPGAENKGWVIVEGEADDIAYNQLLNGSDRMVMKAGYTAKDNSKHGGKKAVQRMVDVALHEHWTTRIIGIIDRDYMDFESTTSELPPNVYCTDKRDLEMSLWSIEEVRNSLVHYLSTNPVQRARRLTEAKLDKVLEICRYMGTFHVSNAWCGIHRMYEFKQSHYWVSSNSEHDFLEDTVWKKNLFDFYCCECSSAPVPVKFTAEMHQETIDHFDLLRRNLSEFGRGHDFLGILSSVMIDTTGYSENKLTRYMINACTHELFRTTHLYAKLRSWQEEQGLQLVA